MQGQPFHHCEFKRIEIVKTQPVFVVCMFLLGVACVTSLQAQTKSLPNVILVMADDLGIGDVQPTNKDCKIKTPNLVAMASQGLTFMDAHTPSAVCTPTRYGLMTGRYSWRTRLQRGVVQGFDPCLIAEDRPTVCLLYTSDAADE